MTGGPGLGRAEIAGREARGPRALRLAPFRRRQGLEKAQNGDGRHFRQGNSNDAPAPLPCRVGAASAPYRRRQGVGSAPGAGSSNARARDPRRPCEGPRPSRSKPRRAGPSVPDAQSARKLRKTAPNPLKNLRRRRFCRRSRRAWPPRSASMTVASGAARRSPGYFTFTGRRARRRSTAAWSAGAR